MKRHVSSLEVKHDICREIMDIAHDGSHEVIIKKLPQTRTAKQNRALHKWCSMVAGELNNGGYSVPIVLSDAVDGEWDGDAVKALMWKKVQKVVIGKTSTADANTDEYTPVYEILNRFLGSKFGLSVPWPNKERSQ
jgi:hypothetical protein